MIVVRYRHNKPYHKSIIHKLEKAEEYLEEAIECFKSASIEDDDEDSYENDYEYEEEVSYKRPKTQIHSRYGYKRMK